MEEVGGSKSVIDRAAMMTGVVNFHTKCLPGGSKLSAAETTAASRLPESTRTALLEALLQPFKQVGP